MYLKKKWFSFYSDEETKNVNHSNKIKSPSVNELKNLLVINTTKIYVQHCHCSTYTAKNKKDNM